MSEYLKNRSYGPSTKQLLNNFPGEGQKWIVYKKKKVHCKIFKKTYFEEYLQTAASVIFSKPEG